MTDLSLTYKREKEGKSSKLFTGTIVCIALFAIFFVPFASRQVAQSTMREIYLLSEKAGSNVGNKLKLQSYGYFGGRGKEIEANVQDLKVETALDFDKDIRFRITGRFLPYLVMSKGGEYHHKEALEKALKGQPVTFYEFQNNK